MKKWKLGVLTALLALSMTACSAKETATTEATPAPAVETTATPAPTAEPTSVPTATPEPTETLAKEDTYAKGIITEEGFESEWMGLRFTKPATVIMATQEEMDADYTQPEDVPATDAGNLAAEVEALRESNAQLQEALELLLSGEVV